jgi:TM2 domain-containing membrane protein YozV
MNNKINYILEIFWLIIAVLSIIAGIHQTINEGIRHSWLFFLIALIGLCMFILRRNFRKPNSG